MTDPSPPPSRGRARKSPTLVIPLVTGLLALIGGAISVVYQGLATTRLERDRFRAQLILQAVQTGDRAQAVTNLRFVADLGLLDTALAGRLRALDTTTTPVLPAAFQTGGSSSPPSLSPGSPLNVRVRLAYKAAVSWSRIQTPNLSDSSPGILGPGDTLFPIPYGGTIVVHARNLTTNQTEERTVDCTRSERCSTAF